MFNYLAEKILGRYRARQAAHQEHIIARAVLLGMEATKVELHPMDWDEDGPVSMLVTRLPVKVQKHNEDVPVQGAALIYRHTMYQLAYEYLRQLDEISNPTRLSQCRNFLRGYSLSA